MIGTDSPENRSTAAGSGRGAAAPNTAPGATGRPARMLAVATAGFAVTFWAWALLSPLGATLREQLGATAFQQSLLVAVPVIVGSLGRIPVGALTDRLGARRMFPVVALLTVLPVLYLGHFADSLTGYLIGGFFLGLGGTTFAIGVPFVNAWYPPARRGLALGIFGAGMGGTAISAFTTVQLTKAIGPSFPFDLVAVVLVVYAAAAYLLLRDRADRPVATGSMLGRLATTLRMAATWQLSFLYAVAFGGFVAFSVYLPTYLTTAYQLDRADAALRTAGFVVLAVAMRPIGGWLCDRLRPIAVLATAFAVVATFAVLAAFQLPLIPVATDRVPRDGRRARDRHRCGVRPRRPHGRRRTSRRRHRCRRRRRRARWILPAAGHGPGLRLSRQLRRRIPAARRHRGHGRGIHRDDRATPRRGRDASRVDSGEAPRTERTATRVASRAPTAGLPDKVAESRGTGRRGWREVRGPARPCRTSRAVLRPLTRIRE